MKNNNKDYTELQLHYLDLDEYICENIYPINNIVFTEKINWLKGALIAGGVIGLGFLIHLILKSLSSSKAKQEKIKSGKKQLKEQQEQNKEKAAEANLTPKQQKTINLVDEASSTELKTKIIPEIINSSSESEISSNNTKEQIIDSNDSQKEKLNKSNDSQKDNKIDTKENSPESIKPEKSDEELQKEIETLNAKNKESEEQLRSLKAQNNQIMSNIRQVSQNALKLQSIVNDKEIKFNEMHKRVDKLAAELLNDIKSYEQKVEKIDENQKQIEEKTKDLENKKIDQNKIETKSLPVETIKDNYDIEFDNFIDLYNENMKIINFTLKYISYHYSDLKNISIEYNIKKESAFDYSPLKAILSGIHNIASNLECLTYLFFNIDSEFKLSLVNTADNKSTLNPNNLFDIDIDNNKLRIAKSAFIEDLLKYDTLSNNPWLNIYI